jgi:dihydroorotase
MSATIIRGAEVDGRACDLVLEGEAIVEVAPAGSATTAGTVVDADGLVALPGLVDLHTHLREPGREDAETVDDDY